MLITKGGGGLPQVDKKFPTVNIINFKKVDKPKGGRGSENGEKVIFFYPV